jgi:hypothetical protein
MMKSYPVFVAIAVLLSASVGVGIAVTRHRATDSDPIAAETQPSQSSPTEPESGASETPESSPAETEEDAALTDFPHARITITDEVEPGSEFDRFRTQLRQAVTERDVDFIKRLIPDKVGIGFGIPRSADELELDDPDAWFWAVLEKAIAPGCSPETAGNYPTLDPGSDVWICPNVTQAFYEQFPPPANTDGIEYEMERTIIVGQDVNVRSQPDTNSPIIARLSNEIVETNTDAWADLYQNGSEAEIERIGHPTQGWTAVRLPTGEPGYVSRRYAYAPLDARVVFGKVNGDWQILYVPAGD